MNIKSILLTVMLFVSYSSLASATPADIEAPAKDSLVALGDSIVTGYHLGAENQQLSKESFPFLVGNDAQMKVTDLGVPGWKSSDLLAALQTTPFEQAVRDADAVLLNIGNNDLLQTVLPLLGRMTDKEHPLTIQEWQQLIVKLLGDAAVARVEFQQNLPKILDQVGEETSSPIVVYTFYNPFPVGHLFHPMTKLLLDPMNEVIFQTVAAKGNPQILLADAASKFQQHELEYVRLSEGDIHPTPQGQKALAELAQEALAGSSKK